VKRDPETEDVCRRLALPFDPKDVKVKPQTVKNNRALAMHFIDARLVMDRLDDVVGCENWQDEYTPLGNGSVLCRLSVRFGTEWVSKTDVGGESEQPDSGDRAKSAVSDALKRAAVKFGIGRYLYRIPSRWHDYDPAKKQFASAPPLPDWAIPASAKPCGPATGKRLAGLIATVCERTGKDPTLTTNALLEEYGVPEGRGLESLSGADASQVLQRLNAKIAELAAGPKSNPAMQPAPAGK
jgi:hypothetical protein